MNLSVEKVAITKVLIQENGKEVIKAIKKAYAVLEFDFTGICGEGVLLTSDGLADLLNNLDNLGLTNNETDLIKTLITEYEKENNDAVDHILFTPVEFDII